MTQGLAGPSENMAVATCDINSIERDLMDSAEWHEVISYSLQCIKSLAVLSNH